MTKLKSLGLLLLFQGLWVGITMAGPPFVVDDPETVEYQHWEINLASQMERDPDGISGNAAMFEVNYGAAENLQLHFLIPEEISDPHDDQPRHGWGDIELGAKYRFLNDEKDQFQAGIFPIIQLPSFDSSRGFGTPVCNAFLPVWLQKDLDPWTTYGGLGYVINPGVHEQNWWFMGWQAQRKITDHLSLGGEIFHETAQEPGAASDTFINGGGSWDFSERYHLLFSAGHSVQGPSTAIAYLGFLITLGPEGKQAGGD